MSTVLRSRKAAIIYVAIIGTAIVISLSILLYKALMSIFNPWVALILMIAIEEGIRFIVKRSRRNGRL